MDRTVDLEKAGRLLKNLRESRGWSRPQLAERTGKSTAGIRNIEKNWRGDGKGTRPYASTIGIFARVFGPEDGKLLLEAFGYEDLTDTLFGDNPIPIISGTGFTRQQEDIIARIVGLLVELTRSSEPVAPVVNLASFGAIPRSVKTLVENVWAAEEVAA